MRNWLFISVTALICLSIESKILKDDSLITDENEAIQFLTDENTKLAEQLRIISEAQWDYATDINNDTEQQQELAQTRYNAFRKQQSIDAKKYDWSGFNETNQRQFEKLAVIGTSALEGDDETTYIKVSTEMETIYSSAKICLCYKCGLALDPDLGEIMATSKNYDELQEVWVNWRDASGKLMRDRYITYYTLGNKAATLNKLPNQDFNTLDDLWLFVWETPTIKEDTASLWEQLRPFYEKLHAYVRIKMEKAFPGRMPNDRTIPAHLLGNMWAQQWSNIMNTVEGIDPFPNVETIDVTQALIDQKYDAKKMFDLSDEFFGDLGLDKMTQIFWDKSVIVNPNDGRDMVCHASAWDFYTKDDFRIKQCTKINMEDLITVHHEMGHIEYFMQYQNQPTVYRDGANPGFHEAIGDLLALSVSTPKHLTKIGLLNETSANMTQVNLKFQLKMALDKLAFLPFGYIMDRWRWDVFSGDVSSNDLNRHWWELRIKYQGLSPPVKRSEKDFDPGAKYHIPASVEYIRYFVSHILQFQFHKALCDIAEPGVPLHECDIDGNAAAGNKLKQMLQLGSSQKWPQQLEIVTGTQKMDVQPLLEYFQPLQDFLDQELAGQTVGWTASVDDYFESSDISSTITPTTVGSTITPTTVGSTITPTTVGSTITPTTVGSTTAGNYRIRLDVLSLLICGFVVIFMKISY